MGQGSSEREMTGWEKLWRDPEMVKLWGGFPPLPQVVEMADRLEAEGKRRVLDIGCGLGRHTVYLAARGFEVIATDNSPTAIAACRENLAKALHTAGPAGTLIGPLGVPKGGPAGVQAAVLQTEMTEFPFPDGHFHGIVASHVIHHCYRADLEAIIASITRKLAPDGYLVWAMPSTRHCHCGKGTEVEPGTWVDPNHPEGPLPHHYCTEAEVRQLLHDYEIVSLVEQETRVGDQGSHLHWRVLARKTLRA